MTTSVSRIMLALALAGLTTLPAVSHAATAVGWQKSLTEVFSAKTAVRAASTTNIALSGVQVVDGISLVSGDRVLVKNQAMPAQNGIYIVSAGVWTRATDSDHWGKFIGANVLVAEGAANGKSAWLSTATAGTGVLDTSSLTFAKLSGATTSSLASLSTNGLVVNNAGTIVSRSLMAGSNRLAILAGDGVAGNPTLDVIESNIAINNLNGTLNVAKGGLGVESLALNGVLYGNGTGDVQVTVPGTGGQLLLAGATGVPTFASLSGDATLAATGVITLANSGVAAGTYGNATAAPVFSVDAKGRLTSAGVVTITPAWTSITGKPTTVAGYGITDINSYAPTLTGVGASGTWGISVTGNAATATKLATARTISATGDATWSTTFDGSGNSTGVLTLANSGVAAGTYGSATTAPVYTVDAKGRITAASNVTITPAWTSVTGKPTTVAGYGITDINSYAPTLAGVGASGTWGINVSGNAANATQVVVTDSRAVVDTPESVNRGVTFDFKGNAANGLNDGGTYNGVMTFRKWGTSTDWSGGVAHQLGFTDNGDMWLRSGSGTTWGAWQEMVDTTNIRNFAPTLAGVGATGTWGISVTGNAATASKLATARTISATGDATWSTTFDGSGNATGVVTLANSGVAAGTYGTAWSAPTFTVDSKGRLTSAGTITITPAWTSVTGKPTTVSGYGITDINSYAPTLAGSGASGTWPISISGGIESTQASLGYSVSGGNVDYAGQGGPQVRGQGNGAAMLSLHRPGNYAINLGLGTDNQLRVGGWSRGASYVVLDSGNYASYAPSLTGAGASGTWGINVTGNAATASAVTGLTLSSSANPVAPDNVTQNQLGYANSVSLFGQTDGGLYSSAYSSSWIHQIYGDFRTGQLAVRGKNSGAWQGWRTVLDSGNYNSYAPSLTGVGASGTWGISVTGNAATATKLATARSISATGDATWSTTFDGAGNATGVLTLANSGVVAGTYGNSTTVPVFSVDAKGRVTGVTNTPIAPAWSNISGKPTTVAGFLGADSADVSNITQRVGSGFYQNNVSTQALGWPTNSNGWFHLLSSTHQNTANYYAMQLAADFYNQRLYYRSTNGNGATAWNEVIHSGNVGSYAMPANGGVNSDFDIASSTNNSSYSAATIELRELNHGGAQTGALSEAPRLGFHWGGRVAAQIAMNTDGTIMIRDNPGTSYEKFAAGNVTANGTLTATGNLSLTAANPYIYSGGSYIIVPNGAYFSGGTVYVAGALQARGGLNNDTGNLVLSSTGGGTIINNNQMQLAAVAANGAGCGVAGAVARDSANNVYICK